MNRCGIAWFLAIYKVMKCYFTKKAANQPLPSGGVYRGRTDDLMAASHAL